MNCCCAVIYHDVVVASAEEGGLILGVQFRNRQLEGVIELRNLTLTEEGQRLFSGNYYDKAFGKRVLEIEIRNSDGSTEKFARCMADTAGLSLTPKTASLSSLNFWVLKPDAHVT